MIIFDVDSWLELSLARLVIVLSRFRQKVEQWSN